MGNAAKKATKDEEERDPPDDEEVDGEDGDDDEDEDEDEDDDEDGEESDDEDDEEVDDETALALDICQALRDALEAQVSVMVLGKKIMLDLDDDSHWELRLKRRD